jgi:hypothetical protein
MRRKRKKKIYVRWEIEEEDVDKNGRIEGRGRRLDESGKEKEEEES